MVTSGRRARLASVASVAVGLGLALTTWAADPPGPPPPPPGVGVKPPPPPVPTAGAGVTLPARSGPVTGTPAGAAATTPANPVNPLLNLTPEQIYNLSALGKALANVPPWVFGYNPYPSPVIAPVGPYTVPSTTAATGTVPAMPPAATYSGPPGATITSVPGGSGSGNSAVASLPPVPTYNPATSYLAPVSPSSFFPYGPQTYGGFPGPFFGGGGFPGGAAMMSSPGFNGGAGFGGGGMGGAGMIPPWNGFQSQSSYYTYNYNPSEFVRGTADVINASGTFLMQKAQSKIYANQAESGRIDNHRKLIEQWLWERNNLPTRADDLIRDQREQVRQALVTNNLPDILNASALNKIVNDLILNKGNQALRGQPVPIDPGVLKQINVVSQSGGSPAAFKNLREDGKLAWPLALLGEAFAKEVAAIDRQALEAVNLATRSGKVNPGTLSDLNAAVNNLDVKLRQQHEYLTFRQRIDAARFVQQLKEAVFALEKPDASKYFTDIYVAKGKTVPDLIEYMKTTGLKFGPAVGGDEPAYVAMYNYLAAYYNSLSAPVATRE